MLSRREWFTRLMVAIAAGWPIAVASRKRQHKSQQGSGEIPGPPQQHAGVRHVQVPHPVRRRSRGMLPAAIRAGMIGQGRMIGPRANGAGNDGGGTCQVVEKVASEPDRLVRPLSAHQCEQHPR